MSRYNNLPFVVGNPSQQILDTLGNEMDVTMQNVSNFGGAIASPGIAIFVSDDQSGLDSDFDLNGFPRQGWLLTDIAFGIVGNEKTLYKFKGKLYARANPLSVGNASIEIWSRKVSEIPQQS